MHVNGLDHLVLTVADIERTCDFYVRVLGMEAMTFGAGRRALRFGSQKLNLHRRGAEVQPASRRPTPGSADLCFITPIPLESVVRHLESQHVDIIKGPVPRNGALGPIQSVYFRDPDGNLLEVSNYADGD